MTFQSIFWKKKSDISNFFQANFNNVTKTIAFLEQLKFAELKPVFKKDSRSDKKTAFTCPKLTIKTLEQVVKYGQS